ncbi:MAG: pyruvate dehydrogenase (acetyl-transferring), homodimeric type [Verrucomicrobiales bacterium]
MRFTNASNLAHLRSPETGPEVTRSRAETWELVDWLESLEDVIALRGPDHAAALLRDLQVHAQLEGVNLPVTSRTPYINTIPHDEEPDYPGDLELERKIRSLVRWNAMAMVVRANHEHAGIGGHVSTFASIANLYEVGLNHFFRGPGHPGGGDLVYFQGHASPGNYARAFLEGRLEASHLDNFRRDLAADGGLSSYPHPWLMPDFWQFPTVSMGLGPIMAVYQARYLRYLEDRGLASSPEGLPHRERRKVWCFVGDGETDEPEALAALSLAARAKLDNLVFVVNCNLQRLDGPVRGNGKIVQELEAVFRGVGWHTLKVIWGSDWDDLLDRDTEGRLVRRMGEVVDGDYQNYGVRGGAYIREHFFGEDPVLAEIVEDYSDEQLWKRGYGGHDPVKVHAAYHRAVRHEGAPTVILAKTIKGYGLGEAGEGRNVTHQQKKLNHEELLQFRERFEVPLPASDVLDAPFFRPSEDSPERRYLKERRRKLGGWLPQRRKPVIDIESPADDYFVEFREGSDQSASTTMVFVRLLGNLLKDEKMGARLVPIVADEARTFGMEALFRQVGIYSPFGQVYEPVDSESLLYYREASDGQLLEEGITEAGAMSSFIAAGTSASNHGVATIPLFIFYSMFGFQRVGDLIWAAGDSRARGFLVGATSGRTTLNGEGLQHEDGQSHVNALAVPNLFAYDTAFAFEVAEIFQEGFRRMVDEDVLFYLTVGNESYPQPPAPEGAREGILRGMYRFRDSGSDDDSRRVQLLGSGALLNEAIAASDLLAEKFDVAADVWSVTSYQQLYRDASAAEREHRLDPESEPRRTWVAECLAGAPGPVVAVSDYLKVLPDLLGRHLGRRLHSLGTDGYGRSDTRPGLRDFFEVDRRSIALAALYELMRDGQIEAADVSRARDELGIEPDRPDPATA